MTLFPIHRRTAAASALTLVAVLCVTGVSEVNASQRTMTCRGPNESYIVRFDDRAQKFAVIASNDLTDYSVHSVSENCGEKVMQGNTTLDGPSYQAFISGRKRIEYYRGQQRVQTDFCE